VIFTKTADETFNFFDKKHLIFAKKKHQKNKNSIIDARAMETINF